MLVSTPGTPLPLSPLSEMAPDGLGPATFALRAERFANSQKLKTNPYDEDLRIIKDRVRIIPRLVF